MTVARSGSRSRDAAAPWTLAAASPVRHS